MPYDADGNSISMADAKEQWVPVARDYLIESARRYNGYITYKQLAERIQSVTGIRHDGLLPNWIGGVLEPIVHDSQAAGIPAITALCVKEDGTVGDGYRAVLDAAGQHIESLDELDDHAARARLECYRYYGAELPPGGGVPTLTPKARASRQARSAKAKKSLPLQICPTCNTALPATGICDDGPH